MEEQRENIRFLKTLKGLPSHSFEAGKTNVIREVNEFIDALAVAPIGNLLADREADTITAESATVRMVEDLTPTFAKIDEVMLLDVSTDFMAFLKEMDVDARRDPN